MKPTISAAINTLNEEKTYPLRYGRFSFGLMKSLLFLHVDHPTGEAALYFESKCILK
jgi:hypothetical protein